MGGAFGEISQVVIGAAIDVHRDLGPGLLESVYERCLAYELEQRRMVVERQKPIDVTFKGLHLEHAFKADLVVNGSLIVEVKSIDSLQNIHAAQLRSYLRLARCDLGLLINFNVPILRHGIRRVRTLSAPPVLPSLPLPPS